MSKLMELYEKRNKAVAAARSFLESKRTNGDILSAEDNAAYEKMEAEIVGFGREIERENRLAAIDAELAKPTSNPITNTPQQPNAPQTGRFFDYRADFIS